MMEEINEKKLSTLKEKKKIPTVIELKEIAVGIKNEDDYIIEGKKRELLEIYKEEYKDIKGDKNRIEEIYKKEYFYSPATE